MFIILYKYVYLYNKSTSVICMQFKQNQINCSCVTFTLWKRNVLFFIQICAQLIVFFFLCSTSVTFCNKSLNKHFDKLQNNSIILYCDLPASTTCKFIKFLWTKERRNLNKLNRHLKQIMIGSTTLSFSYVLFIISLLLLDIRDFFFFFSLCKSQPTRGQRSIKLVLQFVNFNLFFVLNCDFNINFYQHFRN